jgi:DNA polymerase V
MTGGLRPNADAVALEIVGRVRRWTGVPVSVGLGTTKTLAKLASEIAKAEARAGRGNGIRRLDAGTAEIADVLAATPAGDIWGIGRHLAERLKGKGIRTALALRDADTFMIRKLLSVSGEATQLELRGVPCLDDGKGPPPRKSMVSSQSFGQKVEDRDSLAQAIARHCAILGAKLRTEGLAAGTVAVRVRTGRYTDDPGCELEAQGDLPERTADTMLLTRHAARLLDGIYRPGFPYAKAGVMLLDIGGAGSRQQSLFGGLPEEARVRGERIMAAMDAVNRRYGRDVMHLAAQGPKDAPWRASSKMRSPRYTTRFTEIPVVRPGHPEPAGPAGGSRLRRDPAEGVDWETYPGDGDREEDLSLEEDAQARWEDGEDCGEAWDEARDDGREGHGGGIARASGGHGEDGEGGAQGGSSGRRRGAGGAARQPHSPARRKKIAFVDLPSENGSLFEIARCAGFPALKRLSLERPAATFVLAEGTDGRRLLVVDRGAEPEDGSLVVAVLDGELTTRRLHHVRIPAAGESSGRDTATPRRVVLVDAGGGRCDVTGHEDDVVFGVVVWRVLKGERTARRP